MKGAAELISFAMVIMVTVSAIAIVVIFGLPIIDEGREAGIVNEARHNLRLMDNSIREAASQGVGSLRSTNLKVNGGEYRVDVDTNSFEFRLPLKTDAIQKGTFVDDQGILTSVTGEGSATQNSTHIVLENELLRAVFLRSGNETAFVDINASTALKYIDYKTGSAATIAPSVMGVKINDTWNTSWGVGYTKLAFEGSNVPNPSMLLHLRSNFTGTEYEVLYTLPASSDFMTIDVRNVTAGNKTLTYAYKIGSNSTNDLTNIAGLNQTTFSVAGSQQSVSAVSIFRIMQNVNFSKTTNTTNVAINSTSSVAYYNASDGSLRNVTELGEIGQGSWNVSSNSTHILINHTLAGSDGFDFGLRDSAVGGSYWLEANGSLRGRVNVSNDFMRVGMTETDLKVYNSSGKVIFNTSFNDAVKVDNQNLISLYGSGTQNKTVYFFDWASQDWKFWGIRKPLDFQDSFLSNNWNESDPSKINVSATSSAIEATFVADNTNDAIAYDLQRSLGQNTNASDFGWVLRFKARFGSLSSGSRIWLGLSDSPNSTSQTGSQDFVGLLYVHNANVFTAQDTDGSSLPTGTGDDMKAGSLNSGSDYYFEIRRTSDTTYETSFYTDSGFRNLGNRSYGTTSSNVRNLRYIKFLNEHDVRAGSITATIDDVMFWNNVTSVPTAGVPDWLDPRNKQAFKWKYAFVRSGTTINSLNMTFHMTAHDPFVRTFIDADPTLIEDYSNNNSWQQVATKVTVNNRFPGRVHFSAVDVNDDHRVNRSLGYTMSDYNWTADFDFRVTGSSGNGDYEVLAFTAGGGNPNNATQDMIGMHILTTASPTLYASYKDGSGSRTLSGSMSVSTNTDYWGRIERTSATSVRLSVFTSPDRSTHASGSPINFAIPSTVNGLTNLQHATCGYPGCGSGASLTMTFDNLLITQLSSNITVPFSLPENRTSVTNAEPGLAAFWNFNDGSGINATENVGGNGLSMGAGSAAAMPVWVSNSSCVYGGCLGFDSNDIMSRGSTSFLSDQQGSISVWLKYSGTGDTETILDANDAATSTTDRFIVYQSTGNILHPALIYDNGAPILNAQITSAITDTNWHHLVTTSDGSTIRAYLDGTERSLNIAQGSNTGQWFGDLSISRINVGANYLSGSDGFDGFMDDLRVYSRPLSLSEVRQLYLTGLNQQKPGIYFTKNNATDNEEVLFATTNWKNVNHTGFNFFSNQTNYFGLNYTFNSTMNQNFMFALGTMGRMNTTIFNPTNNATGFSSETMENVANSTLTWYDIPNSTIYEDFTSMSEWQWINSSGTVRAGSGRGSVTISTTWYNPDRFFRQVSLNGYPVFDFEYKTNSIGTTSGTYFTPLSVCETEGHPVTGTQQYCIRFSIYDGHSTPPVMPYLVEMENGVGITTTALTGNEMTVGTTYYMRVFFNGDGSYTMTAYTDPGRTNVFETKTLTPARMKPSWMFKYINVLHMIDAPDNSVSSWEMGNLSVWNMSAAHHTFLPSFNNDGGAVGIWRLDNGIGLDATDSSGSRNTGTLNNGPTWLVNSSCKYGNCLSFDGSNDFVAVASNPSLVLGNEISVEMWVKKRANGVKYILLGKTDDASPYNGFQLSYEADNRARFASTIGSSWLDVYSGAVTDAEWHHLVGVYRPGEHAIFVDGLKRAVSRGGALNVNNNNDMRIGKSAGSATPEHTNGIIDEVRVYGRALSDAEVREHYIREVTKYYDDFGTSASGKTYRNFGVEDSNTTLQPVTPRDAVLHYRFNDNSTLNATDSSGAGRTGASINGPTWVTNSSCRYGGCISLDGTNDYLDVCSTCMNFISQRGVFAVSFWMRPNAVSGGNFNIFDQADRANGNGANIAITNSDSNLYFGIRNGGASWVNYVNIPTSNLNVGQWQHIAFVGDGVRTRAYLNGSLVAVSAADFSTVTPSYPSKIGRAHSAGEYYNGYIDDFTIINRTISPDEVYKLYAGGTQRRGGDLVGWWKFNENSTQTNYTLDSSGSGNTANHQNRPTWMNNASCRNNGCVSFDGSNDYAYVNDSDLLDGMNQLTLSAWVKIRGSPTGSSSYILTKQYSVGDGLGGYELSTSGDNSGSIDASFDIGGVSVTMSTTGTDYRDNNWHNVIAKYDGSFMRLYVDGSEKNNATASGKVGNSTLPLTIGARNDLSLPFNGTMDDVKIWRRALTTAEILHEYQQGIAGNDRESLYGRIHRIASTEGVMSTSFNLTDKNNTFETNDYDQRTIYLSGNSTQTTSTPSIAPLCFGNATYRFSCSQDSAEFSSVRSSGISYSGRAGDFIDVCRDSYGQDYLFNVSGRGEFKGVLTFASADCSSLGNQTALIQENGIPSKPIGTYQMSGPSTLRMSISYDRIGLNGTERFGQGDHKVCAERSGRQGSMSIVRVRSC